MEIGSGIDAVEIVLDNKVILFAEEYNVTTSVLKQPSNFTVKITAKDIPGNVVADFPPNTPFDLRIGGLAQFRGKTDGFEVNDDENGSDIVLQGRDSLCDLVSSCVTADQSFSNTSSFEMVRRALNDVGMKSNILVVTNYENLQQKTGAKVPNKGFLASRQYTKANKPITAKAGDRWYEFILRELKRQGLFLWAASSGNIVLGCPNGNQPPIYRIVRDRSRKIGTAIKAHWRNNAENRHSEAIVVAGGGRRGGRQFLPKGQFLDREMIAWNYDRPIVFRDVHASTEEQGRFYAERKLAEERRAGWSLTYTVPGHVTPAIDGTQYYVWSPDTCVEVDDADLGIKGKFWIESCDYVGSDSGKTTTLVLQRPEDLIFADDE